MKKCFTLTCSEITPDILSRVRTCADRAGSRLPFHRPELPTTWWEHFNSSDGAQFTEKRGRNFLGARSWLNDLYYVLAGEGEEIAGAIPMASFSVRLLDSHDPIRMLAFAGDYVLAP